MRAPRRVLPGAWALFAVLALGACDCGAEPAAGPGGEAPPEADRRTIAVIPKGTTHEFWKSVHAGANKAGRDLGVEILWQGPVREDDRAAQIRVVEDMITRRVDGIVLAPLDDQALVPVVTEAHRERIPVVIIDSGLSWDDRVSFVATDNHRGGAMAAERLGELLEGRGEVLVMRYQEGSASTMRREAGFLETMAARFADVEIVSSNRYGGATTETAYATAENLLVSFPDVDAIFCPNESTTFGMLRALSDAGKAGQVKFVGFDSSDRLVEALREGHIHGLVVQNPFRMGEDGVRAVVSHLGGEPVEPRIDTGVVVATRDNMEEEAIRQLLSPDLSAYLEE